MKDQIMKMSRTKKIVSAVAVCGTLIIAAGATTAFAASPDGLLPAVSGVKYLVKNGAAPTKSGSLMVRDQNGKMSYSKDGGKTWTEGAPEGATITTDENGKSTIKMGNPPAGIQGILVKNENGKMSYSKNGGKTWTEGAPEGAVITTDENGKNVIKMGTPPEGFKGILVKNENGKMSYSKDGGKTWTEGTPEGAIMTTDKDGKSTFKMGIPNGAGVMVKNENGKVSYSTDGGKTWSDKAPNGFTVKENNGSISLDGGKGL